MFWEPVFSDCLMPIEYSVLNKKVQRNQAAFNEVSDLASRFRELLNTQRIAEQITEVHRHNATSTQIQSIVRPDVEVLGFASEKKNLFDDYPVPALRPDFYREVCDTGVILEVERGKTIANNMDLLDLWKCHICKEAEFLFLLVPNKRQTLDGKASKPYYQVKKRLSTFFEEQNYVNVEAVFLFGYGET